MRVNQGLGQERDVGREYDDGLSIRSDEHGERVRESSELSDGQSDYVRLGTSQKFEILTGRADF